MPRWHITPSKPGAVLSLIVGVGILVVGMTSADKFTPAVALWAICLVAILGVNLWSAFSSHGRTYTVESRRGDDAGRRR